MSCQKDPPSNTIRYIKEGCLPFAIGDSIIDKSVDVLFIDYDIVNSRPISIGNFDIEYSPFGEMMSASNNEVKIELIQKEGHITHILRELHPNGGVYSRTLFWDDNRIRKIDEVILYEGDSWFLTYSFQYGDNSRNFESIEEGRSNFSSSHASWTSSKYAIHYFEYDDQITPFENFNFPLFWERNVWDLSLTDNNITSIVTDYSDNTTPNDTVQYTYSFNSFSSAIGYPSKRTIPGVEKTTYSYLYCP